MKILVLPSWWAHKTFKISITSSHCHLFKTRNGEKLFNLVWSLRSLSPGNKTYSSQILKISRARRRSSKRSVLQQRRVEPQLHLAACVQSDSVISDLSITCERTAFFRVALQFWCTRMWGWDSWCTCLVLVKLLWLWGAEVCGHWPEQTLGAGSEQPSAQRWQSEVGWRVKQPVQMGVSVSR